ncbi:MAG: hypothetical protein M0Q90_01565 [Bacteroidales bacterium]|nr:hypothetical protein [Bacteroidales bacterium]
MEKYLQQLIEDLETAAKNPPKRPYIEPPPFLEDDDVMAELALIPYLTIEELTGIKQEAFPEVIQMQGEQWQKLNDAIFKVFESLHLDLVDAPAGIPPEVLYEVLTTNWQHPVQYLPSSGMDLELCTGDPMSCPYGDYCDCDEAFDAYELPEKFTNSITHIVQLLESGNICYLEPDTLEMEYVPKITLDDAPHESTVNAGFDLADQALKHEKWDNCYVFKPLEKSDSLKIMKAFAKSMEDEILQEHLLFVLNHVKAFENFNAVISKSGQSDNWFYFKMMWLEDHVKQIIYFNIHQLPDNADNNDLPF